MFSCKGSNACRSCGDSNPKTDTVKVDMNLGGIDGNKENRTPSRESTREPVPESKMEEQARQRFASAGAGAEERAELEAEALKAEEALRRLEQRKAQEEAERQRLHEEMRRLDEEAQERQRQQDQTRLEEDFRLVKEAERLRAEEEEREAEQRRKVEEEEKEKEQARLAQEQREKREKEQAELQSKLTEYLQTWGFKGLNEPKKVKTGFLSSGFSYPLHLAVKANDVPTVEFLLKVGASRELQDSSKLKPVGLARKLDKNGSHKQVIALLTTHASE